MSLVCIFPTKNLKKAVHLDGGRTSNGTKIQLWDRTGPRGIDFENQLWIWNGTTFISFKNPIKCLHLAGGGTGNGTKIQLWDILSDSHPLRLNQEWRFDGKNIVSRKKDSACWHLENGGTGNGTKIQLWNVKNHANGTWRLAKLKSNPGRVPFRRRALCMIVPLKNPGKTVHLVGGNTGNGTKIQLMDRVALGNDGYENQLWLVQGTLIVSSKNDRKCLHFENGRTSNGTKIVLWDVVQADHPNQQWRIEGKNIVCRKNSSACWHLENGRTDNGTKIVLWNNKTHENGFWKIEKVFNAKM